MGRLLLGVCSRGPRSRQHRAHPHAPDRALASRHTQWPGSRGFPALPLPSRPAALSPKFDSHTLSPSWTATLPPQGWWEGEWRGEHQTLLRSRETGGGPAVIREGQRGREGLGSCESHRPTLFHFPRLRLPLMVGRSLRGPTGFQNRHLPSPGALWPRAPDRWAQWAPELTRAARCECGRFLPGAPQQRALQQACPDAHVPTHPHTQVQRCPSPGGRVVRREGRCDVCPRRSLLALARGDHGECGCQG